ncbi:MAG TPA: transglutaminase domain-containing protein [Desulfatiglandales bacterium]|nr:transglutaminase domain-containing protein [Desulfatiglandales bacterium]
MRKSVIYKISGIVIVLFWLFVLGELVKRNHFDEKNAGITDIGNINYEGADSQEWMEIFLKGRKVGYTVTSLKKSKSGFEVRERIFLTVNLMGSVREIMSYTKAELDEKFFLKDFDFSLISNLVVFKMSGTLKGQDLSITLGEKGKETSTLVRLPSKPMVSAGIMQFFRSRKLKAGESFTFPVFDPVTMTTNSAIIKVLGKETIKLEGKPYKAFRLEMNLLGRQLFFWLDENGISLKEEGFMGFTLVRSTPDKSLLGLDSSTSTDFYDLSAIKIEKEIHNPLELSYLKVQLNQVPSSLPVDGLRQTLNSNILEIKKEVPPFKALYDIPYKGNDNSLLNHLNPEMFIESDDKEIIGLAEKIVGKTSDPFTAAHMILAWVFNNLEKTPVISVPDAKEILVSKKGDCNEHATIMTALLRAAGIPAKTIVGLVYKDGKFYYHAWNEAYINQWMSMDATLDQMPADATHIKLISGGIEKQIQLVGIIGNLELNILDYR